MDVEKTIEFLLRQQARADARFNARFDRADERFRKAEVRLDRLERVVAQANRVVTQLVRYGVSLHCDLRRLAYESHAEIDRLAEAHADTERALKNLIRTMAHRNGGR